MRTPRPDDRTRAHAQRLRRDSSYPERRLWSHLRARQLDGIKFRRQHPMGPFVVDFYCPAARLVVEIDGRSHDGRLEGDADREFYLQRAGLRVVRVTNDEVLSNVEGVLMMIHATATARMQE